MKTNRYLLPHAFKKVGWIMFALFAVLYVSVMIYTSDLHWTWDTVTNMYIPSKSMSPALNRFLAGGPYDIATMAFIMPLLSIVSLLMIAFSREKVEDEYIMKLRGDSLIWVVIASSILYLLYVPLEVLGLITPKGQVPPYTLPFNIVLMLALYIIRFNLVLFSLRFNIAVKIRLRHEK